MRSNVPRVIRPDRDDTDYRGEARGEARGRRAILQRAWTLVGPEFANELDRLATIDSMAAVVEQRAAR